MLIQGQMGGVDFESAASRRLFGRHEPRFGAFSPYPLAMKPAALSAAVLCLLTPAAQSRAAYAASDPTVIFSAYDFPGGGGVHLPSILVTHKGTVIALCQHRKEAT